MRDALLHGQRTARALLARRGKTTQRKSERGLLIAEGDSWFHFPGVDVLAALEDDYGYRVESVAHRGDTLESMAYDGAQLRGLARVFEHVAEDGREPRVILLSAGGNDVAGEEFALLLNHAASGLPALNERIVEGVLQERIRFAYGSAIGALTTLSKSLFGRKIPILLHGYARPVPDGRGYLGGFWLLPGPWLRPGFAAKGYHDIPTNLEVVADLINRLNDLLESIAGAPGFEHVRHVDLRALLSNAINDDEYKRSWSDELHPTNAGFQRVAQAFNDAIEAAAPPRETGVHE